MCPLFLGERSTADLPLQGSMIAHHLKKADKDRICVTDCCEIHFLVKAVLQVYEIYRCLLCTHVGFWFANEIHVMNYICVMASR